MERWHVVFIAFDFSQFRQQVCTRWGVMMMLDMLVVVM